MTRVSAYNPVLLLSPKFYTPELCPLHSASLQKQKTDVDVYPPNLCKIITYSLTNIFNVDSRLLLATFSNTNSKSRVIYLVRNMPVSNYSVTTSSLSLVTPIDNDFTIFQHYDQHLQASTRRTQRSLIQWTPFAAYICTLCTHPAQCIQTARMSLSMQSMQQLQLKAECK